MNVRQHPGKTTMLDELYSRYTTQCITESVPVGKTQFTLAIKTIFSATSVRKTVGGVRMAAFEDLAFPSEAPQPSDASSIPSGWIVLCCSGSETTYCKKQTWRLMA